ncbi:MAG TPA: TadE/TadG family type IV pilus assembly protein [Rhodopila sp.]|jgi:Flp pilus assembly protein TadG|nr:TadE/TadG family type IV pilus assembly protein [Rhodopila sp.]
MRQTHRHSEQKQPESHDLLRDDSGVSAVEFALVAPVLLMILLGVMQLGITFNNYIALTDSVRAGSRVLAAARSSTTPYSDATGAVYASAPTLKAGSITLSLSVNGTACAGDGPCATALTGAAGSTANVHATYPCDLLIFGVDYVPSCTLTASTTERVE